VGYLVRAGKVVPMLVVGLQAGDVPDVTERRAEESPWFSLFAQTPLSTTTL